MRLVRLRDQDHAARVLVEPVHDAEPFRAAARGELRSAMMNQGVHQRAGPIPHRRMHDEPRLLVQRQHRVILIENLKRNRLAQ
jgi:hypothetical protein